MRRYLELLDGLVTSFDLATVDNRLVRLRDLYELGDLTKADYLSRREALQGERESLTAPAVPSFVRQRTTLRSLCDGWDEHAR